MIDHDAACRSAGIIPPVEIGGKTTCPHCIETRRRKTRKDLRIIPSSPGIFFATCYRCGYKEWL
jgi:hypothetical protein